MIHQIEANKRYHISYDFNDDLEARWIKGLVIETDDEVVLFKLDEGQIVELERLRIDQQRSFPELEPITQWNP